MIHGGFKELLDEFLLEAQERADEVESLLLRLTSGDPATRDAALAQARRELHTLKGNAGMMGFSDLQQLAHQMEDQVDQLDLSAPQIDDLLSGLDVMRQGLREISSQTEELAAPVMAEFEETQPAPVEGAEEVAAVAHELGGSVRVPFSKIDQLVELQAEALIFRNRLLDAVQRGKARSKLSVDGDRDVKTMVAAWEDVEHAAQSLEKTLNFLHDHITDLGMVPLQGLFRSLRRIVHDESRREGKLAELTIHGGETPIDKTLLEAAADALGHLVRNAVIHGIERPEERLGQGKPQSGTVRVSANVDGSEVLIDVADDGAGIDLTALRAQAERKHGHRDLGSDIALLFEEGVSTRQATDLSAGRGVGLSAVKKSVENHGGRIDVRSERGRGTRFSIRLPLTASILRSLTLRADGEDYALPLTAVVETLRPHLRDRHRINNAGVVRWRGRVVPLLDLGLAFGTSAAPRHNGFVIMMEINGRYRALAVDEIVGIHDIVVKGLDSIVGRPVGISGSTILGDGRVIMILNPASLATISPFVSEPSASGPAASGPIASGPIASGR